MVRIELEILGVKNLREDLCVAQFAIGQAYGGVITSEYAKGRIDRIQAILDQLDVLRPLSPDGKHANRHTEFCGCEDK